MNTYGIYFSFGSETLRLPINPEELPISIEGDNGSYDVLGIGPIVQPRKPKGKQLQFTGLFPGSPDAMTITRDAFLEPEKYIKFFESAMNDKRVIVYTPVRYKEDGTAYATGVTGFRCIVENFTYTEKGGETSDFYFDLTITEYRDYTPVLVSEINAESYTQEPNRASGTLAVGSAITASGTYYMTSGGDGPAYQANGVSGVLGRIETGKLYPYFIRTVNGFLGWFKKDSITEV